MVLLKLVNLPTGYELYHIDPFYLETSIKRIEYIINTLNILTNF